MRNADTVLKTAIANSGLGEMDAATLANVKWLMTYINDSKASNVGQLFMAAQTYVWDHQSYKGEPGGDGDAGGYANADTYEMYLSLIDWCSRRKRRRTRHFSVRSRNMLHRAEWRLSWRTTVQSGRYSHFRATARTSPSSTITARASCA